MTEQGCLSHGSAHSSQCSAQPGLNSRTEGHTLLMVQMPDEVQMLRVDQHFAGSFPASFLSPRHPRGARPSTATSSHPMSVEPQALHSMHLL